MPWFTCKNPSGFIFSFVFTVCFDDNTWWMSRRYVEHNIQRLAINFKMTHEHMIKFQRWLKPLDIGHATCILNCYWKRNYSRKTKSNRSISVLIFLELSLQSFAFIVKLTKVWYQLYPSIKKKKKRIAEWFGHIFKFVRKKKEKKQIWITMISWITFCLCSSFTVVQHNKTDSKEQIKCLLNHGAPHKIRPGFVSFFFFSNEKRSEKRTFLSALMVTVFSGKIEITLVI